MDWYLGALLALDQSYLVFTPISQIMWHGSRVSWTDINIAKKAQKLLFIFIDMLYTYYLPTYIFTKYYFVCYYIINIYGANQVYFPFLMGKKLPSHSVIYIFISIWTKFILLLQVVERIIINKDHLPFFVRKKNFTLKNY